MLGLAMSQKKNHDKNKIYEAYYMEQLKNLWYLPNIEHAIAFQ